MTDFDKELLDSIKTYCKKNIPDCDLSHLQTHEQLKMLRPILQEMAMKYKTDVEDIFIKYMDASTMDAASQDSKINNIFKELNH